MREVKIEAIVNSHSGPGHAEGIQHTLAEAFKAAGLDARISLAQTGAEVIALAQQAISGDADAIVAGGGDGTISSVAAVVLKSNKLLGVLPFGTMNHFAKDLGIPLELEAAVETIRAGQVTKVDVGEVNGHVFINNSSLGLYPSIVRAREKQQQLGWGKWPAYVWAALAVLRRYPFLNVRIGVDGEQLKSRTPFVFIGNNEYEMETLHVGSRACLDKGELSLYMTNRTGRLGLIRLALRALLGGLRQEKDFVSLCTQEIWIETRHQHMRVALDGEVIRIAPPLHYRVRPGALRVLAPPSAHEKILRQIQ
ncbi:MAG TPA: diacylglycerol kinase family protein [Pyrinomonadaceae bacterium]|jgi:diacylglycerol kinase family enzyme|nr:diacylglycerol kinase family protein [Pyrinomonadaceae bacterium]